MAFPTRVSAIEHTLSVVIPVYQGAGTLESVVDELAPFTVGARTPLGRRYRVVEVVLVNDCGPDGSEAVCRAMAERHGWIRVVWLSRNYGQHAATLAGIAATGGQWVVTLDEDGQHDPGAIADMLDLAISAGLQVVYANPSNRPPHGWARNAASRITKSIAAGLLTGGDLANFHSFRLVLGEVARGMAAFCGPGVYLDVALNWVSTPAGYWPVAMRAEGGRRSGYSLRALSSHFWRLVISSGTRPLRFISVVGATLSTIGFFFAAVAVLRRLLDEVPVEGWTSVFVALLITSGFLMLALGVIAEYIAVAVKMAMGRPLYLVVSDPASGPLSDTEEFGSR